MTGSSRHCLHVDREVGFGQPETDEGRGDTELSVDAEAGREAFTYVLHSGRTGTVHVEQVLKYNQARPTSAISCCTD